VLVRFFFFGRQESAIHRRAEEARERARLAQLAQREEDRRASRREIERLRAAHTAAIQRHVMQYSGSPHDLSADGAADDIIAGSGPPQQVQSAADRGGSSGSSSSGEAGGHLGVLGAVLRRPLPHEYLAPLAEDVVRALKQAHRYAALVHLALVHLALVWSGPSSRLTGAREREGKRDTQRERERGHAERERARAACC
jgi:hypothetical protein